MAYTHLPRRRKPNTSLKANVMLYKIKIIRWSLVALSGNS